MSQTSPETETLREVIAGIVDPTAKFEDIEGVQWSRFEMERRELAYRKADAILALNKPGYAQTPAVSRDKIATLIQSMCAEHVYFDSQEYELMGVGKMSYAVADKLLADSSTDLAKDDDIRALNEEIERMRAAISSPIREAGK